MSCTVGKLNRLGEMVVSNLAWTMENRDGDEVGS